MATTTPTETTQITSTIPDWLKPYAFQILGNVFGDPNAPGTSGLMNLGYQPYMVPKRDDQGNIIKDDSGNPVMVPGQRTADFSPLQRQAFENIGGMDVSSQLAQATGLAGLAGLRAGELSKYDAARAQNFYDSPAFQQMGTTYNQITAPGGYTPGQIQAERVAADQVAANYAYDPERVREQRLKEYRMGPAALVNAQQFGLGSAAQYMSPYMQDVVERQKRAAVQDYSRNIPAIQAAGIRAGGRGGTREALIESEARRNLSNQLGDIQAGGLQSAYQQAMQQYNVDQAQRMQAQLANQAAIQDVARQNLQAAMGIQQLGAGQNLQAQLANQQAAQRSAEFGSGQNLQANLANQQAAMQAALANQQTGMQAQQLNQAAGQRAYEFGAGQGLQAQQLNQAAQLQQQQQALAQMASANQFAQQNAAQRAQYGLAGANLAEQSRQFGAGLGLQGLQQQLAAAGALGGLGMQQYQQQMGINQALLGAGGQQQALNQELLNQQYQDFINQQQFPYKQAEFAMGILRGLPATGQTQTLYQQPGSLFGQIAGVGLGLGSLFGGFGSTTGATTSDRRLKSNIVRVGTHALGIGVYEYDIWGMRQRGVMADEVLKVMPEAVTVQDNGYMAVYYNMIGGV